MSDPTNGNACNDAQVGRLAKLRAGDVIRVRVTTAEGTVADFVATAKHDRADQEDELGGHTALTSLVGWTTGPLTPKSSSFLLVWVQFLGSATVQVRIEALRNGVVVRSYCRTVSGKKDEWALASQVTVKTV